jgi:hypothetical protein
MQRYIGGMRKQQLQRQQQHPLRLYLAKIITQGPHKATQQAAARRAAEQGRLRHDASMWAARSLVCVACSRHG